MLLLDHSQDTNLSSSPSYQRRLKPLRHYPNSHNTNIVQAIYNLLFHSLVPSPEPLLYLSYANVIVLGNVSSPMQAT